MIDCEDDDGATGVEEVAASTPGAILAALLHWNDIAGEKASTRMRFIKFTSSLNRQLCEQDLTAAVSDTNTQENRELIELENILFDLRRQIGDYRQNLSDELSDIFRIHSEIEVMNSTSLGLHFPVMRLSLSLVDAIRIQVLTEVQLMRALEGSLDTFYEDCNVWSLFKQLGEIHVALKRRSLSENLAFYAAVHDPIPDDVNAYVPLECREVVPAAPSDSEQSKCIPCMKGAWYSQVTEKIIANKSVRMAAATFLDDAVTIPTETSLTVILVIGDEGCGKSFLCNEIESMAQDSAFVIRPHLPLDILGGSVGAAEDIIVSILGTIIKRNCRIIVLLDDVDLLLVGREDRDHTQSRIQSTFLTVLDALGGSMAPPKHVLVIGFSRTMCGAFASRCDALLTIGNPDSRERRSLLMNQLRIEVPMEDDRPLDDRNIEGLLAGLIDATAGRSYSEIKFLCRQAVERSSMIQGRTTSAHDRMQCLDERLSMVMPASMKNGLADELMDIRVITSADLIEGHQEMQLMGQSAKEAWDELVGAIVLPLCRSSELNQLMMNIEIDSAPKALCGGVLLTGAPYSGKSFLAHRCACYAASLKPSVKLLVVSCTSLLHKEVGSSENTIRRLFDCIRKAAPCIVVLDAVENIAAVRGHDTTTEGTLDRVLSALLVELDGIEEYGAKPGDGFAVIGITQYPTSIDSALLRPGRLDKVLELVRDW